MISDSTQRLCIKAKLVNEIIKDRINKLDDNIMKENCDFVLNCSEVIFLNEVGCRTSYEE